MINFGSFFFSYIHIQCYKCSPSTVWLYPTKFDKLCFHFHLVQNILNFLMVLVVKNLLANAGDAGSISGLGRCPGGGNGNPLQYSCLENRMDRGAWRATVCRVTDSQTRLKQLSMHAFFFAQVLFRSRLFNLHVFLYFPVVCLLFISSLILLKVWQQTLYSFYYFKFAKLCFMAQKAVSLGNYSC